MGFDLLFPNNGHGVALAVAEGFVAGTNEPRLFRVVVTKEDPIRHVGTCWQTTSDAKEAVELTLRELGLGIEVLINMPLTGPAN